MSFSRQKKYRFPAELAGKRYFCQKENCGRTSWLSAGWSGARCPFFRRRR